MAAHIRKQEILELSGKLLKHKLHHVPDHDFSKLVSLIATDWLLGDKTWQDPEITRAIVELEQKISSEPSNPGRFHLGQVSEGVAAKLTELMVAREEPFSEAALKLFRFLSDLAPHPVWAEVLVLDFQADAETLAQWTRGRAKEFATYHGLSYRLFQKQLEGNTLDSPVLPTKDWTCGIDATDFDYDKETADEVVLPTLNEIFQKLNGAVVGDDETLYPDLEWLWRLYLGICIGQTMKMLDTSTLLGEGKAEQPIGVIVIEYEEDTYLGKLTRAGWKPFKAWKFIEDYQE